MSWVDSLSEGDIAELYKLWKRAGDDTQAFIDYLILAVTIRTTGPTSPADLLERVDTVWRHLYAEQFELRSDGLVYLKGDPPHLELIHGGRP